MTGSLFPRRRFAWHIVLFLALIFSACAGLVQVRSPGAPTFPPAGQFLAGIGRADLTPPPGLPLFGFSVAAKVAQGYRTRLYVRAIYLEDAQGERLALVQCDLGAISALLHRQVAARIVEETGITADRLLIAATHTHSAPGAYFGTALYNLLGAPRPGFDARLLEFLTDRISAAILEAHRSRVAAKFAVGEIRIPGVTRNRSFVAYQANRTPNLSTSAETAINDTLTLLRVDRVDGDNAKPLGAFSIFAIHGTTVNYDGDLYSGDSFAAAERIFEDRVKKHYRLNEDVVQALVSGAAGDAAPNFTEQGFDEAHRLGRIIADSAFALFTSLDGELRDGITLRRQFIEIDLRRGYRVGGRPLSRRAVYGAASLSGSEEGGPPGPFRTEGMRLAMPVGVQTWKKPAFGDLQSFLPSVDYPTSMTLQIMQVGNMLLANLPAEITTEMGRRLKDACLARARHALPGVQKVALVCLANQYMSYVTTPEEYSRQQYEGGSNLYGENTGPFMQAQLTQLIDKLGRGEAPVLNHHWSFAPGLKRRFIKKRNLQGVSRRIEEVASKDCVASLTWIDQPPGTFDFGDVLVRIETQDAAGNWQPFVKDEMPVDDRGLEIEVRVLGKVEYGWRWRATWLPSCPSPAGTFRLVILEREGRPALFSLPFSF